MLTPNAIKICEKVGGYQHCNECPICAACCADYPNTEEFEIAVEKAAIEYLEGK